MVDLRGHFSNPDALIEALEEMEEVLASSSRAKDDYLIKQVLELDPR